MINGTLNEGLRFTTAIHPTQGTASTTLYNGSAVSISNNGIDTRSYDEILIKVSSGTMYDGSTLNFAVYESESNDPSAATLASYDDQEGTDTDATFTQITDSDDEQVGFLKTAMTKRYLWVQSYQSSVTVNFEASYVLGKADTLPVDNLATFEIGF